jgi:hypothetical protein
LRRQSYRCFRMLRLFVLQSSYFMHISFFVEQSGEDISCIRFVFDFD